MNDTSYCTRCGHEVDWVDSAQAARFLEITDTRVRQLLDAGRIPGAEKRGNPPSWRIPIRTLKLFQEAR